MSENLPLPGFYVDNNIKNVFKDTVNQLISDMGRTVYLYLKPTASGCPNCGIGPDGSSNGVYNVSNPFPLGRYNKTFGRGAVCPVCIGSHKILAENKVHYEANINWSPKDVSFQELGIRPQDVVRTKMQICAYEDILQAEKAVIDGIICVKVKDPIKYGLKDITFVRTFWRKIN